MINKIMKIFFGLAGIVGAFTWIVFTTYLLPQVLAIPTLKHPEIMKQLLGFGISSVAIFICYFGFTLAWSITEKRKGMSSMGIKAGDFLK